MEPIRSNLLSHQDGIRKYIWVQEYFNDQGLRHREDGPAIECEDGENAWYVDGKLHRDDGPAIDHKDYKAWYTRGILDKAEFSSGYIYMRPGYWSEGLRSF